MLVVAATERELALVDGADTLCCGIGPVEAAAAHGARARRAPAGRRAAHRYRRRSHVEPLALVLGSEAVYCE